MPELKIKEIFAVGNSGQAISYETQESAPFDESIFEKNTAEIRQYFRNRYGEFKQIIQFKDDRYYLDFTLGKHIFFKIDKDSFGSGFVRTYIEGETGPERVAKVCQHLKVMIDQLRESYEPLQITRLSTPEFSFYTYQTPFSVEEYIEIANFITHEFQTLPPDMHGIFSSFPVLWKDNNLHNCVIYACSALSSTERPILYHMTKMHQSMVDYRYQDSHGVYYQHGSALACLPQYRPSVILAGSPFTLNAPEQYQGVVQLRSSSGQLFINVVGICLDHQEDIERIQVHQLIEQLLDSGQKPSLYLSHVLSSASIASSPENFLSETVHVDVAKQQRRHPKKAAVQVSEPIETDLSFIQYENYPSYEVSIMHSDILQHALARLSLKEKEELLNLENEAGETLLMKVLKESDELLMDKRVYSLILHGANFGPQEQALVEQMSAERQNDLISVIDAAISWKLQYNLQMSYLDEQGYNPITAILLSAGIGSLSLEKVKQLILAGYSPFHLDASQQSLFKSYFQLEKKYRHEIIRCIKQVQNGLLSTHFELDSEDYRRRKPGLFFQAMLPKDTKQTRKIQLLELYNNFFQAEKTKELKLFYLGKIIEEFKVLSPPEQNLNFHWVLERYFPHLVNQQMVYTPELIQAFWETKYAELYRSLPEDIVFDRSNQFWSAFGNAPEALRHEIYIKFKRQILESIRIYSSVQKMTRWLIPSDLEDFKSYVMTQTEFYESLREYIMILAVLDDGQRTVLFNRIKSQLSLKDLTESMMKRLNEEEKQYFFAQIPSVNLSTWSKKEMIYAISELPLDYAFILISKIDSSFYDTIAIDDIEELIFIPEPIIKAIWSRLQDKVLQFDFSDLLNQMEQGPSFPFLFSAIISSVSDEQLRSCLETPTNHSKVFSCIRQALSEAQLEPFVVAKWINAIPIEKLTYVQSRLNIENLDDQNYYHSIYELLSPDYQEKLIKPSPSSCGPHGP